MNLLPTDEQRSLIDAVRPVAQALRPGELARGLEAGRPIPASSWATMAEQGWFGLGLAEAAGGVGYGLVEQAMLIRELGRQVLPGPVLPTILAAHVAAAAGLDSVTQQLVRGEVVAGWYVQPSTALHLRSVADLPVVGLVSVSDRDVALLAIPDAAEPRPCVDPGATLDRLTAGPGAPLARAPLTETAWVLLAALGSGLAQGATEASVAHACTREQFGRPIGAFQAVKHRCADMAVRAEAAWSQTAYAALRLVDPTAEPTADPTADPDPGTARQVAAAVSVAVRAATRNAADNVQNHGGMGFTWEADAHLFVGRARMLSVLSTSSSHRRALLRTG